MPSKSWSRRIYETVAYNGGKNETDEKREFTIDNNYCKFDSNRSEFHFHFK